jgi:hypothetical protein
MAKIKQSTGYASRNRSVLCLGKFLHHQVRICIDEDWTCASSSILIHSNQSIKSSKNATNGTGKSFYYRGVYVIIRARNELLRFGTRNGSIQIDTTN